jgi:hypothetical protein
MLIFWWISKILEVELSEISSMTLPMIRMDATLLALEVVGQHQVYRLLIVVFEDVDDLRFQGVAAH